MSDASILTHAQIWSAIDALALHCDMTASGLARKAGLDPTTFNKSKRVAPDGRERWPSTESIAKILAATGASLRFFMGLIGEEAASARRPLPLIGLAQAGDGGFFGDGGFPVGGGWDEIDFPALSDPNAYALEIAGDSMSPAFRDGDRIIVSPNAPVRRGDRVVVKTRAGEVLAKELRRQTAKTLELQSLNSSHPDRILSFEEIEWLARILWVSQ